MRILRWLWEHTPRVYYEPLMAWRLREWPNRTHAHVPPFLVYWTKAAERRDRAGADEVRAEVEAELRKEAALEDPRR